MNTLNTFEDYVYSLVDTIAYEGYNDPETGLWFDDVSPYKDSCIQSLLGLRESLRNGDPAQKQIVAQALEICGLD